jgi:hypothetical protein
LKNRRTELPGSAIPHSEQTLQLKILGSVQFFE